MKYSVLTQYPIAFDSLDHIMPHGAINDNTKRIRFVNKVRNLCNKPKISYMDLGCAGGGLVSQFLAEGQDAIGLEGSDWPQKLKLGEWGNIPDNLFTCDISRYFEVWDEEGPATFDCITAWEVLEHLPANRLGQALDNIAQHLRDDGFFVASVPVVHDVHEPWHLIQQPTNWWIERMKDSPLQLYDNPFSLLQLPRGWENPEKSLILFMMRKK